MGNVGNDEYLVELVEGIFFSFFLVSRMQPVHKTDECLRRGGLNYETDLAISRKKRRRGEEGDSQCMHDKKGGSS